MADTNLMKNYSVLFPMTVSGVGILLFCLGEVLHLLEMKRQQNIFIMLSLLFKALYKNKKNRRCWFTQGRSDTWWSNLMQGISHLDFWTKDLRLSRNQCFNLTNELQPYISPSLLPLNHRALNADKKTCTLYYLKDTGSLIMKE